MAEREADGVVELLGDEYVKTILVAAREDPKSVDSLSDACGADASTVYRRVERMTEADLLEEELRIDPGGHHYKEYQTALSAVHVHVADDGYRVEVDRETEEAPADRFTRLYEGFK